MSTKVGVDGTTIYGVGVPRRSSSQHELARLCWRKWWLRHVAKFSEPERRHFLVGTALHAIAEAWIRDQSRLSPIDPTQDLAVLNPQELAWVRAQAKAAQSTGLWRGWPGVVTEQVFALAIGPRDGDLPTGLRARIAPGSTRQLIDVLEPMPAGTRAVFTGLIDVVLPPAAAGDLVWCDDHKTAKNRRYAKTAKDFGELLQPLIYPIVAMHMHPHADQTQAGFRYNMHLKDIDLEELQDKPQKACYPVEGIIARADMAREWSSIEREDLIMQELARIPAINKDLPSDRSRMDPDRARNWKQVPGALEAHPGDMRAADKICGAFGGCAFKDLCFGRCDHRQMAARLDRPQRPTSTSTKPTPVSRPSLKERMLAQQREAAASITKEPPMAFNTTATPKPIEIDDEVFVLDPEEPEWQAKAIVVELQPPNAIVILFGGPDRPSNQLDELPPQILPISAMSRTPHPGATLAYYTLEGRMCPSETQEQTPMATNCASPIDGSDGVIAHGVFADNDLNRGHAYYSRLIGRPVQIMRHHDNFYDVEFEAIPGRWTPATNLLTERITITRGLGVEAAIPEESPIDMPPSDAVDENTANMVEAAESSAARPKMTWGKKMQVEQPAQDPATQAVQDPVQQDPASATQDPATQVAQDPPAQPTIIDQALTIGTMTVKAEDGVAAIRQVAEALFAQNVRPAMWVEGLEQPMRFHIAKIGDEGVTVGRQAYPTPWDRIKAICPADEVPIPGDEKDAQRVTKVVETAAKIQEGPQAILAEIRTIITEGLAKKPSTIGKKASIRLMELVDMLGVAGEVAVVEPAAQAATPAPAPSAADLNKTYNEGITAGMTKVLSAMLNVIKERMPAEADRAADQIQKTLWMTP